MQSYNSRYLSILPRFLVFEVWTSAVSRGYLCDTAMLPWEAAVVRQKPGLTAVSASIFFRGWSRQPITVRCRNIVSSHGHRASDPMLSEGHLDVRGSRSTSTNVFTNTIYRKPTFTGLMTNWNSFVPFSYKKASVVSMIQQILSVCSTYSLLDIELETGWHCSQLNVYPRELIDTGIGLTKYRNRNNNEPKLCVAARRSPIHR